MENAAQVITYRTADGNVLPIECHEALPSTAVFAREYARKGYPDHYCIFAQAQTDTTLTGTRLSEGTTDSGVFISCILRPRFFPSQAGPLGELCAVALASALEQHTDRLMDIGWISDIYCEGKRIGGCALESKLDAYTAYEYLIVTFAVHTDGRLFPCRLSDMVKEVFSENHAAVPLRMCESILDRFFHLYRNMQAVHTFLDDYRRRFIMTGLPVSYQEGEKKHRGRILGIDPDDGCLRIDLGRAGMRKVAGRANLTLPKRVHKRKVT